MALEFTIATIRSMPTAWALRTVDDRARLRLLLEATHTAMTDEAIIPLHFQASTWAARRGTAIEPRTDERICRRHFGRLIGRPPPIWRSRAKIQ